MMHAVHSRAATGGCHSRTREHKRQRRNSDNSDFRHARSSFWFSNAGPSIDADGGSARSPKG
jgi:hypothetical protein